MCASRDVTGSRGTESRGGFVRADIYSCIDERNVEESAMGTIGIECGLGSSETSLIDKLFI